MKTITKTDAHLQRDVVDELNWEPSVNGAQVGVTAKEGVITLTGHVESNSEKHAAEVAAKRIHGVRAVANEIEVRPSAAQVHDDEEIAAAAVHALEWNADIPAEKLQVAIEQGWLTVEGTVDESFQKTAVDRALRHLAGVKGVTNSIVVAPRELIAENKAAIEAAFQRSSTLNSKRLGAEIEGTTVVLTGEVHSHAELEEAVRIAASAPGVGSVQNCVTITPWGFGPAEEWGY